jgi:hypothetical protein
MGKLAVIGPALAAAVGVLTALASVRNPQAAAPPAVVSSPALPADVAEPDQEPDPPQPPAPAQASRPSAAPKEQLPLAVISAGHRSAARAKARRLETILGLDPEQTRRVDEILLDCVQRSLATMGAPTLTVNDFECLGDVPDQLHRRLSELLAESQRENLRDTLDILDSVVFDADSGDYSLPLDLSGLPDEIRKRARRQLRWFDASSGLVATRRGIELDSPEESAALMGRLRIRLLERMTPLLPPERLKILRDLLP